MADFWLDATNCGASEGRELGRVLGVKDGAGRGNKELAMDLDVEESAVGTTVGAGERVLGLNDGYVVSIVLGRFELEVDASVEYNAGEMLDMAEGAAVVLTDGPTDEIAAGRKVLAALGCAAGKLLVSDDGAGVDGIAGRREIALRGVFE